MKTVFAALGGAIGTTLACWRLIFLLWLVVGLAAWVVMSPLRGDIYAAYEHNPITPTLLGAFDTESYVDFLNVHEDAVAGTTRLMRRAALPWILLWTVLSAGVLGRIVEGRRARGFLAACGRYGHRFVWLTAMTLLVLWGVAWVNDGLTWLTTRWLVGGPEGGDTGAGVMGWTMTVKTVVALGLLGLVTTSGRVAQLRVVTLGERFAPVTWLRALGSVLRHLPSMALGRLLSYWPLLVLLWLYLLGRDALQDDSFLPMLQPWVRTALVFQGLAFGVQAALVYRLAVLARLWPIVAPAGAADVAGGAGGAGAAAAAGAADAGVAGSTDAAPDAATGSDPGAAAATVPGDAANSQPLSASEASEWLRKDVGDGGARAALWAAILLGAGGALHAQDAGDLSIHRNAYVMDATIDLAGQSVTARQTATFINTTSLPVDALWMHLYPAAFANSESIWIEGGERREAIVERGAQDGGYIDVKSVRGPDAGVEPGRATSGQDLRDRTTIDDTLMRIELASPVPPGGSVTLEIEFVTRFPRIIARMGMAGPHMDGMQWFPKFCAHDESGWHNNLFWNRGEFFADFGTYDVTFHYPETFAGRTVELEATGTPTEERADGAGTMTKRYQASDVHDFAFVADPNAVRFEEEWTDASTGRTVQVVYLCQPYAVPKARQVLDLMQSCLTSSADWWMPYPYPRIVIDGLPSSRGGGMEYPMLFTISQRFPSHLTWFNELTEDPASVTAHEFGHQYWYGIVATNEVEEGFLDEGFNTWGTNQLLEAWWPDRGTTGALRALDRTLAVDVFNGAWKGDLPGLGAVLSLQGVVGWNTSPFFEAPPAPPSETERKLLGFNVPSVGSLRLSDMSADRPAWWKGRYYDDARARPLSAPSREFSRGYGSLLYNKTALVLQTLRNLLGDDTMRHLMRTYVERHRFGHPTRGDFLAVASEVTGGAHDALLVQLLETNGTLDFSVDEVSSQRVDALVGYTPQTRPGDPITWQDPAARDDEDAPRPWWERAWSGVFTIPFPGEAAPPATTDGAASSDEAADAGPSETWRTRFVVRQLGEIETPVDVEARFVDGTARQLSWDGEGSFRIFELESTAKLDAVVVDPERHYIIDLDRNNNGHRMKRATAEVQVLDAYTHFWTENALAGWSMLF